MRSYFAGHGGALGVTIALLVVAALAAVPGTLHAPGPPRGSDTVLGPQGYVRGWRHAGDLSWNLLSEFSAHRVQVLRVETPVVDRAREIAGRLVDAGGGKYDEILVYVYRPASGRRLAERRVKWTRSGGYDELVLVPVPRPSQR